MTNDETGAAASGDPLVAALDAGRFDEARALASARIAANENDAQSWKILAVLDAQAGRYDDALENNEAALRADPSDAGAWLNHGNLLRLLGRLDECRECYSRVLENDPNHTGAAFTLAALEEEAGNHAAAESEYARILDLDSDHGPARFNLARRLAESGRSDEALDHYQYLTQSKPLWPDPWRNRANLLRRQGRNAEAADCFEVLCRMDPSDAVSQHLLQASRGVTPEGSKPEYVERVFDEYAENFDSSMETLLEYNGAKGLADELRAVEMSPTGTALDLGCGTGLLVVELAEFDLDWVGVDLSKEMVRLAQEKRLYQRLEVADVHAFLEEQEQSFVLCTAADVLVYIGELGPLFAAVRERLQAGGLFAFCTERWEGPASDDEVPGGRVSELTPPDGQGFRLEPSGRFSYRDEYVKRVLDDAQFDTLRWTRGPLRREGGTVLQGSFVVARRR